MTDDHTKNLIVDSPSPVADDGAVLSSPAAPDDAALPTPAAVDAGATWYYREYARVFPGFSSNVPFPWLQAIAAVGAGVLSPATVDGSILHRSLADVGSSVSLVKLITLKKLVIAL